MVKIPILNKYPDTGESGETYDLEERTRCVHGIILEGDRVKFIHGVNYCRVCEENGTKRP